MGRSVSHLVFATVMLCLVAFPLTAGAQFDGNDQVESRLPAPSRAATMKSADFPLVKPSQSKRHEPQTSHTPPSSPHPEPTPPSSPHPEPTPPSSPHPEPTPSSSRSVPLQWRVVTPDPQANRPQGRFWHRGRVISDASNTTDYLIVYGGASLRPNGTTSIFEAYDDTWIFSSQSNSWAEVQTRPASHCSDQVTIQDSASEHHQTTRPFEYRTVVGIDGEFTADVPSARGLYAEAHVVLSHRNTYDNSTKHLLIINGGFTISNDAPAHSPQGDNRVVLNDTWALEVDRDNMSPTPKGNRCAWGWRKVEATWSDNANAHTINNTFRLGHAAVAYENSVFFFGGFAGRKYESSTMKASNQLIRLDLYEKQPHTQGAQPILAGSWSVVMEQTLISPRGVVASALCGTKWIIGGGINTHNVIQNDTWHIDVENAKMEITKLEHAAQPLGGLAETSATCVNDTSLSPPGLYVYAFGGAQGGKVLPLDLIYSNRTFPANTAGVYRLRVGDATAEWEPVVEDNKPALFAQAQVPDARLGAVLGSVTHREEDPSMAAPSTPTQYLLIHGGIDTFSVTMTNDTWALFPDKKLWIPSDAVVQPPKLYSHQSLALGDALYVIGGWQNNYYETMKVWKFDLNRRSWAGLPLRGLASLNQTIPSRALFVASKYNDTAIFLFGGAYTEKDGSWVYYNDMYIIDVATRRFEPIENTAGNLGDMKINQTAGMAFAPTDDGVYLHGGKSKKEQCGCHAVIDDSLWWFDYHALQWQMIAPAAGSEVPPARWGHTMALLKRDVDDVLVIYGGRDEEKVMYDMWIYDVTNRTWQPLSYHVHYNQTFQFDVMPSNGSKPNVDVRLFPGLVGAARVSLPSDRKIVVQGGANSVASETVEQAKDSLSKLENENFVNALWEFDLNTTTWTRLETTDTEGDLDAAADAAMTVIADPTSHEGYVDVLLYGGTNAVKTFSTTIRVTLGCNAGFYSPFYANTSCLPCDKGHYNALPGAMQCSGVCKQGVITNDTGNTSPNSCNTCTEDFCSGHGRCRVDADGNPACHCKFGFMGKRCNDLGFIIGVSVSLVTLILLVVFSRTIYSWFARLRDERNKANAEAATALVRYQEMESNWLISPRDVDLIRRIDKHSEGTFAEVWLGIWQEEQVAVKRVNPAGKAISLVDSCIAGDFQNEIRKLRKLRHRNLVVFHGAGDWGDLPFLVTEYCERGSLFQILQSNQDLSYHLRLSLAVDAARGLRFLHTRRPPEIHRDIKSPNLLVTEQWVCKVADFGTLSLLSDLREQADAEEVEGYVYVNYPGSDSGTGSEPRLGSTERAGTLTWMAPEVMRMGGEYGRFSDVYSFGIVLWELATRQVPYSNTGIRTSRQLMEHVLTGHRPMPDPTPDQASPEFCKLMRQCWSQNADDRPAMNKVFTRLEALYNLHAPENMPASSVDDDMSNA